MQYFIKSAALLAFVLFCGCKDSVTNSGIPGTMVGYVNFIDSAYESWVYKVEGHLSGVHVALDGTQFQAVTDTSGKWIMTNVPAGTYSITYTKPGYASVKNISHSFVGNGTDYVGEVIMDQVPILHITLILKPFEDYHAPDSTVVPLGTAPLACDVPEWSNSNGYEGMLQWCIFFSNTDQIDPNNPNSYLFQTIFQSAEYNISIYKNTFHTLGFKTDDKVYCVAYALTYQCQYDYYLDLNSNKKIYTGFSPNHSEVRSFVLP